MRGKQQNSRSQPTAILVAAGCLAGCLTAALITPAFAAPAARHASTARPDVMLVGQPDGIAADPATHTFWVAETQIGKQTDLVARVTEAKHAVTTFHVAKGVTLIAADPSRGLIWSTSNTVSGSTHTETVTFIKESDQSVHAVTLPIGVPPTGLAVDPAAGKVFVLDLNGDVFTFDENHLTNAPVKFITGSLTDATGLAVDHGTGSLWMLNATGNSVFEFNESTGASVGSPVSVGNNPDVITVDASTKTVWVGAQDSTLSEFSEASPGTVNSLTLGSVPFSIVADHARHLIWVGGEFGAIYGVTEKTSPPSMTGSLKVASLVDGLDIDPTTGQLWASEQVPSQGSFDNVVPFVPAAPAFTSPKSTWLAAGNPAQDQFTLTTSGFPLSVFSMRGAPGFLSLAKLTGVLTASLTSTSKLGAFTISVTASNGIGAAAHQSLTLNVGTDPVLKTTSVTFAFGVPNSIQLKAAGTPAPTFQGFGLPKGLTLSKTGVLSGSLPKGTASPKTLFIQMSNAVTAAFGSTVLGFLTLKLVPGVAPKITSPAKVTFRHGRRGVFIVTTTGLPVPTLTEVGRPPAGTHFRIRGGRAFLIGTPTAADAGHTFTLVITASNGVGRKVRQTLAIKIT